MDEKYIELFEEGGKTNGVSVVKEMLSKYLSHLTLLVISLLIFVGIGTLYLLYTSPKFSVTTTILIKNDQSTASSNTSYDLLTYALRGGANVNLNNEVQLLHSTSLLGRIVAKNQFNISYFEMVNFKKIELYPISPVRLIPNDSLIGTTPFKLTISHFTNEGLIGEYGSSFGQKKVLKIQWDKPFSINGDYFKIERQLNPIPNDARYIISWKSIEQAADDLSNELTVSIADKITSVIELAVVIENVKKGQDILNAILDEYRHSNTEQENTIAQNTIRFIDDRLENVSKELTGVEGNLESYQGNNHIINAESQSSQSFENSNDISKNLTAINIQQGIVEMIESYFNSPGENTLVPSSLGIDDATLASLIGKYNELQLKKQRESRLLANNSPALQDLTNQIIDLKASILENLHNIRKNLKLQETSLKQKSNEYSQFLSALPHKERLIQEIKRKQSITEGLYLFLLQKREEAALSASSANISNYRLIDNGKINMNNGMPIPVKPKPWLIMIVSIVLALIFPIVWLGLSNILNDKVSKRNDITSRFQIPMTGEIGHITKPLKREIMVIKEPLFGEQFRTIRTNLALLNQKNKQIILITSSINSEGKSLISLNLAAVLAIPGKKVALLEFDFRKPDLIAKVQKDDHSKGLINFLTSETDELSELSMTLDEFPTLHLFPSGQILQNPGDLLLDKRVGELFAILKSNYDYIIIDSPAVGEVSDALVLRQYSDLVIYVVRYAVTPKKELSLIDQLLVGGNLTNIGIIFNDVRPGVD